MLIYFKVGNYRSIKDPMVLNFTASSISEHTESNVILEGRNELLKSLLLYGHNASGKSNLLEAFVTFKELIKTSATELQSNEVLPIVPFLLNDSTENKPTLFEVKLIVDGVTYRYGCEITTKVIIKEWLFESTALKEYPVFLRIEDGFQVEKRRFANSKDLNLKTRKNALYLSVAAQWNQKKAQKLVEWFSNVFTLHGLMDDEYRKFTMDMLQDKRFTSIIKEFMKKADLGIIDIGLLNIDVQKILDTPSLSQDAKNNIQQRYKNDFRAVATFHIKYDENNNEIGRARLLLDAQGSAGTKKFFNLIGTLIFCIENNFLVIIDELDAGLHSLLAKSIIKLFNDSTLETKAQLLVATHDTTLLDKEVLRRDQIYFTEKDKYGATKVTALVEYKPRKDAPYDKNYLEGKFGGIPMIEDLADIFNG